MNPSLFDLTGKIAIVTGSNTGLGAGMAIALAQAGCDIVGVYHSTPGDTPAAIREIGRRCVDVQANLDTIEPVARIVQEALDAYGQKKDKRKKKRKEKKFRCKIYKRFK